MTPRARVTLLALAFCLLVAPTALAGNGGIAPPDSATPEGSAINSLYWLVIGISIAIFLLVEGVLIWFLLRFRRRPGRAYDEDGPQIHGNTRLELLWTAVPLLILIAIAVVVIVRIPAVQASPEPEEDPLVVEVVGHTFYWQYTYPNGVVSVDTVRLPTDRPVRLELKSYDVIHSWWVPELLGKKDTVPGRTNFLDFTIEKPGSYRGQCAELCGVEHANMYTTVVAVPEPQFDAWLSEQEEAQAAGASSLGQETWEGACAKCHGLDGQGGYGPAIANNSTLSNREAMVRLLEHGQDNEGVPGYMPPISLGWPEKQIDALIGYLVDAGLAPAPAEQEG